MFLVRGVQPFSQKPSLGGKFSPLPKKLYTHKEFSSCQQKERLYNGTNILDLEPSTTQISNRSWSPKTSICKWLPSRISFGKNWLSSGCSCPAPTLPSAPSPPPPEKETGQEGKEKTHLQLDQVSKIEWQVGYIFHILGNNSICRLVLKASTLFLQIDFSRIILLWLGKISPFT